MTLLFCFLRRSCQRNATNRSEQSCVRTAAPKKGDFRLSGSALSNLFTLFSGQDASSNPEDSLPGDDNTDSCSGFRSGDRDNSSHIHMIVAQTVGIVVARAVVIIVVISVFLLIMILRLIFSQVGHCLGLRHNFKGSMGISRCLGAWTAP